MRASDRAAALDADGAATRRRTRRGRRTARPPRATRAAWRLSNEGLRAAAAAADAAREAGAARTREQLAAAADARSRARGVGAPRARAEQRRQGDDRAAAAALDLAASTKRCAAFEARLRAKEEAHDALQERRGPRARAAEAAESAVAKERREASRLRAELTKLAVRDVEADRRALACARSCRRRRRGRGDGQ
ncbi:hypothetical protein SO694_00018410 [Aureococcus anophagefferens]|uniref:Uncharacterized protein n=1 Tax=Aureococcus anophagefferens TaxID=44056 RepID=A0ABR1G0Q3_AURAN